jgi:phosphoribosylformimino-5-aminoimidazole carboxamide ribotide isomerase
MELIPAIDIRGGKCVRLVQGDYARETVFSDDPVATAKQWAEQGAARIHVVDLDAAREGRPVNDGVIRRIVAGSGAAVQVAGGVRDAAAIDRWADAGAARIVIGTLAVEQPAAIEAAVAKHGGRIAIAIDVKAGRPATKGWLESGDASAEDLVRDLAVRGARHFIYTDISRDGLMQHLDYTSLRRMLDVLAATGTPSTLIYSGGVTSIEDVIALDEYGLEGAIVGRALYDGRIDLRAALDALTTGNGTG